MKLCMLGRTLSAVALLISACVASAQSNKVSVKSQPGLDQAMARAVRGFDRNAAGTYFASQPGMGYRAQLTGNGNLTLSAGKTQFGVSVTAFGYGANRGQLGSAASSLAKDKGGWPVLNLRRPVLSEQYVNGENGLHHWLTVSNRPAAAGNLWVRLGVTGDASLKPISDTSFEVHGKSKAFTYGGLHVWDAAGKTLPARLEVSARNVNILVEDAGAKYPVTIDPTWVLAQTLVSPDPDGSPYGEFGYAVAMSGDIVAVGCRGATVNDVQFTGAVYAFERQPDNSWNFIQKIIASDPVQYDYFGHSVAISGDRMVVGDPIKHDRDGAVYFFKRGSDGKWSQTDRRQWEGDRPGPANFGYAVAIDGDNAVISPAAAQEVNFYHRNADETWSKVTVAISPDISSSAFDYFGYTVALSGDLAVVGAYNRFEPSTNTQNGAAHVYARQSDGQWTYQARIMHTDPYFDDRFGRSVDIKNGRIIVGAPKRFIEGAAYVFDRTIGGDWIQTAKITASDGYPFDQFGLKSSLDGESAIVGNYSVGTSYMFKRNADGTWSEQQKLTSPLPASGSSSGRSVVINGTTAIVGLSNTNNYSGAVYIFDLVSPISLAVSPSPIGSYGSGVGTLTLGDPAPAGGATLNLTSASPRVTVPATVTVAAGETVATFPITAGAIPAAEDILISASGRGYVTISTTVSVQPGTLALQMANSTVPSGASVAGTITLSAPAPAGGLTIDLASDQAALSVPATVTVTAGQTVGTFNATAGSVSSDTLATISATNAAFVSASAGVTVQNVPENAEFVSQSVLTSYFAGNQYSVSVTMRNTGQSTWTSSTHRLLSMNPFANSTWGRTDARIPSGTTVAPGATYTFNFVITAPSAAGNYNFQWQMRKLSPTPAAQFGAITPNQVISVVTGDLAEFVSQSVPTLLEPGKKVDVQIIMRNRGSTTWSFDQVRLISKTAPTNLFGKDNVQLLPADSVAPGQYKTFNFRIQAPAAEGDYVFKWQMRRLGVAYFGPETPPITIHVQTANNSQFVSQSVPGTMVKGSVNLVTVTFKNIGTATWTPGNYVLYSQNAPGNNVWRIKTVALTSNVAPGDSVTFSFNATAPTTAGTYNFQWRLRKTGQGDFGDSTPNVAVVVSN